MRMSFNQIIINNMAELDSEGYEQYQLLVVLYTWMASHRGEEYVNYFKFNSTFNYLTDRKPIPFFLLQSKTYQRGYVLINTFPPTGVYNVISDHIFSKAYNTIQRFNYINLVANISPTQRLEYKLYNKAICINKNIVDIDIENTPLITIEKQLIRFPHEEQGATQWQIGHQQKKQVEQVP